MHWGAGGENESSAEAEVAVVKKKNIYIYINIFYYIREHSIPHTARCWQSLKIDRC